ncbi:DUF2507 domain-containing protein [Lacticaseibacillus pabuli]|uniref:DUF2507 domain-containing protein n=1 Tax=Lacticaseibacillus pabuli TaxID=3025672 RepID=A0ABY7WTF9_9LACO|nr:DUF2507 domain-containing protein [Lacticaseibacillus sp. KACC 23028]WDF83401.1 DUF2507 domain-containing protein [Lacticaseibacillus sp. KACC 23028]
MSEADYRDLMNPDVTTTYFGQMILRDELLPSLLGPRLDRIMYFAGRDMGAHFPAKDDEIAGTFTDLGLGNLATSKMKVRERTYTLDGPIVVERLSKHPDADFQFEAGLLAQMVQQALGMSAEAHSVVEGRGKRVAITVAIDPSEEEPLIGEE